MPACRSLLRQRYSGTSLTLLLVKHVPIWFPGASFKRKAREWRKLSRMLIELPFQEVKRKMVRQMVCKLYFDITILGSPQ